MNTYNNVLFSLLREGLQNEKADHDFVVSLSAFPISDWKSIFQMANQHGVGAIAYDGLKEWMKVPEFKAAFPKELLLQWGMHAMKVEQVFNRQYQIASELSDIYDDKSLRTVVLKGFSVAKCYPYPNYRPCCDMDCYLLGKYEEGNTIAKQFGAEVEDGGYKHSHILYKGMMVENHQFLTNFDGTAFGKKVELLLQKEIGDEAGFSYINNSKLIAPSCDFTALFLLKHAHNHFMTEGITLRHLTDWAMFLKSEQEHINWEKVNAHIVTMRLQPFADLLTTWCVKRLRLEVHSQFAFVPCGDKRLQQFEDDLLGPHLMTNGMKWWRKIPIVFARFRRTWRFRYLLTEPMYIKIWITFAYCSYFHRKPNL